MLFYLARILGGGKEGIEGEGGESGVTAERVRSGRRAERVGRRGRRKVYRPSCYGASKSYLYVLYTTHDSSPFTNTLEWSRLLRMFVNSIAKPSLASDFASDLGGIFLSLEIKVPQ